MSDTPTPRIELYVRSLLADGAHERQEAVIERLNRLDEEDQISDFSVLVWGKQISHDSVAAETDEGRYILDRVAGFKEWALSNNVSLESFYQTTQVDSAVTEEAYTATTLPVMGLAEYCDGELQHVAPCTKGDVVHTIVDRLDRLENGEPSALEEYAQSATLV